MFRAHYWFRRLKIILVLLLFCSKFELGRVMLNKKRITALLICLFSTAYAAHIKPCYVTEVALSVSMYDNKHVIIPLSHYGTSFDRSTSNTGTVTVTDPLDKTAKYAFSISGNTTNSQDTVKIRAKMAVITADNVKHEIYQNQSEYFAKENDTIEIPGINYLGGQAIFLKIHVNSLKPY